MKYITFLICLLFYYNFIVFSQENDQNEPVEIGQDVIYWLYRPFTYNSKVISLPEESKLMLFENMPLLDGATALYPVYSAFLRATYYGIPPVGYTYDLDYSYANTQSTLTQIIRCSQTQKAYENLIDGIVDIIFCTEPTGENIEKAKEKGYSFNLLPIGKEAFVFFVNKNNPLNNITSEQIRAIYSGKLTNWYNINGINEPIIAYQRPKNSGSQTILEQVIMKDLEITEPLKENVIAGMREIIGKVVSYKNFSNAIGYSFLFFATEMVNNNEIKLLSIDGIYPSKETIQNNTYPFVNPFFAITKGNETESMKLLLDWILSEQGQYLVEKTGYIPIK